MKLPIVFWCAVLLAFTAQAAAQSPNILFILTDDMGYGDLGCYGSRQIATPNIDALAEGGIRFTQAYVSAPVCAPSRAGILTGRYQQRFGFEHNLSAPEHVKPEWVGIPLDEILVSQRLSALGYRTGLIGKWHVGEHLDAHRPNARGFDSFFGMLGGSHPYWPTPKKNRLRRNAEPVTTIRTPYLTDWFTLEAIDFIREVNNNDGAPARPWFLFLSYNTPHGPLQATEEDLAACAGIEPKQRRIYCAMQRCLDRNIGLLLDALESSGQAERTLVVFANDNGGSVEVSHAINAPLNGTKGTFLEGGIRIPMIFRWPGHLPVGAVYDHPVSSLDLMPTFVAAAGGTIDPVVIGKGRKQRERVIDGIDLLPFLTADRPDAAASARPHDVLYWRMALRGGAIREGDLKLLMTPHHHNRLYDIARDPSEQHDLHAQRPEDVERLKAKFHAWVETFERNPMWISAPFWSGYNRRLYDREYQLTQPE